MRAGWLQFQQTVIAVSGVVGESDPSDVATENDYCNDVVAKIDCLK